MTRDDIIRMAEEASGGRQPDGWGVMLDHEQLERFAALVAAEIMPKEALAEMFEWGKDAGRREEREACAKAAEAVVPRHTECGNKIAAAIRARGQND